MNQDMNQSRSLSAILELTRHMLRMAETEDWQALMALEEARQGIMAAFFAPPWAAERVPGVASALRDVLALNQQIIALSEAGRQQAADGMRQLQQKHRAMQAYDDHQERVA